MGICGGELVTADKPPIVSKQLLDAIMVEDRQSNRCFPNPPCTNESNWSEGFCETDDPFDELVAPKTGPWWWGRGFTRCDPI